MAEKKSSAVTTAIIALREETGFEDDAEVKTARLHEMLGLESEPAREPDESDRAFLRRVRRHEMAAIAPVKELRRRLLRDHKVDLRATGRGVYRIMKRREQADRGVRDGLVAARAAMREGIERAEHVDLARLTPEERQRRDAALLTGKAYLQMLGGRSTSARLEEARKSAANDSAQSTADMPAMRRSEGTAAAGEAGRG